MKNWGKKIFLGKDVRIFPGARFEVLGNGKIAIGDYVKSGQNLFLTTTDCDISIGKYSILSANVFIGTQKSNLFANRENYDSLWFDKDIADLEVTHTIIYDNLKKEFTVTRSWKDNNPEVTKSFDEAKKWMTEI